MSQLPPPQQPQHVRIEVQRNLSGTQNALVTFILAMLAMMMLGFCCMLGALVVLGLMGVGIFGVIFSAIISSIS